MNAAQAALTFFVGPIARVLVRKAAEQARTETEFYENLQSHIAREEDRADFRRRLRKDWDPRVR
jgi:hypothetical protein